LTNGVGVLITEQIIGLKCFLARANDRCLFIYNNMQMLMAKI